MQVWSQNELVGELHVHRRQTMGRHVVLEWLDPAEIPFGAFEPDEPIASPKIQRREFQILHRHLRVEDTQLAVHGEDAVRELMRAYRVPADADRMADVATCETIYRWPVLDLSPVEVEEIFDMDCFEPLDFGAPDVERRLMERDFRLNYGGLTV